MLCTDYLAVLQSRRHHPLDTVDSVMAIMEGVTCADDLEMQVTEGVTCAGDLEMPVPHGEQGKTYSKPSYNPTSKLDPTPAKNPTVPKPTTKPSSKQPTNTAANPTVDSQSLGPPVERRQKSRGNYYVPRERSSTRRRVILNETALSSSSKTRLTTLAGLAKVILMSYAQLTLKIPVSQKVWISPAFLFHDVSTF